MKRFSRYWCETKISRVETLILLALAIGLFVSCVGFFFGKPCSAMPMIIGFSCSLIGAILDSWKQALKFMGGVALLLLATMFTFSYVGTDATTCHYPMQRLLIEGWNPIFQSSLERFMAIPAEGFLTRYHILFMPKISALCGALVASATNLFSGDAFLGYALIFSLWCVSQRFADAQWRCGKWSASVFALAITFSTKITSFLAGQVDYTVYAGFIIGLFALLTWIRGRILGDLCLAFLGLSIAMLAKPAGFVCGAFVILIGGFMVHKDVAFSRAFRIFLLFFIVVGASPFLTAWIQYGGPFYPAMTFDASVETVDITSDFVSNTDGDSMGYLSRIVYAWFSKTLAIKACAWFSGNPDFAPEFYVCGGVGGFGSWFCLLMLGSLVALAVSHKNRIVWLCIFIFFTANLAPLKYIGYSRYFSQIWIIPFLALFNLLYSSYSWLSRYVKRVRIFALIGCVLFMVPFILRTLAYQGMQLRLEHERQQRFEKMREESVEWHCDIPFRYTDIKRFQAAGIKLSDNPNKPKVIYNQQFLMPLEDLSITKRFTICDTVKSILTFPWLEAFASLPHPLWRDTKDFR